MHTSTTPLPDTLQQPRGQARAELQAVITEGQALLRRRSPQDLRATTPAANALAGQLRRWTTSSNQAVTQAFGAAFAEGFRNHRMSYVALKGAQQALRIRVELLTAYLNGLTKLKLSRPPAKPNAAAPPARPSDPVRRYDLCLSFAGEDRALVKKFVQALHRKASEVTLFYDAERKAELWGTDLFEVLGQVYEQRARYCVMFVSRHYIRKKWTRHERQFIISRALEEQDYLLPIRLDDTLVPGLSNGTGHLDARQHTVKELVEVTLEKLRGPPVARPVATPSTPKPRAPRTQPHLLLLGTQVYRVAHFKEQDDTLTVDLWLHTPQAEAALRQQWSQHSSWNPAILPFAHRLQGGLAQLDACVFAATSKRSTATLTLTRQAREQQNIFIGQDQQAHLEDLARWILLAEPPADPYRHSLPRFERELSARLDQGVLTSLRAAWTGDADEFLPIARLQLVQLLFTLGVVDQIQQLRLGPWKGRRCPVSLIGLKAVQYPAATLQIAVKGTAELGSLPGVSARATRTRRSGPR